MAEKDKKYYWLKLKRDFFKRHDIQIIEDMANGKDYILFYLKLLCESVDHEGDLRFSEEIPYNEQMLSTITRTNVDIVRTAVKIFSELGMMEILDDGTYYMSKIEEMIGSETYWAEKKRIQRSGPKLLDNVQSESKECPTCPSKSIEKDIEKDIEKELDKDLDSNNKKNKAFNRFTPPTLEEVQVYCNERNNNIDAERFVDFYSSKGWMIGKNKMKDWKAAIRTWERESDNGSYTGSAPKNTSNVEYESEIDRALRVYGRTTADLKLEDEKLPF